MAKNLIENGDFELGTVGWTGSDMEVYFQDTYLQDGETDLVAELDGRGKGSITIMQQSFEVLNSPLSTTLEFQSALRVDSLDNAQNEGFWVEILDETGNIVSRKGFNPPDATMRDYTMDVNFPSAGTYTLRFTEWGTDDGLGAVIDNIELMICFAGTSMITTEDGERAASEIKAGDMVLTQNGFKPVRWVGRRKISAEQMAAQPKIRPVLIKAGALGENLPKRDLKVSRQHRMFVNSELTSDVLGHSSALVAAVKLTNLNGIEIDNSLEEIEYVHFLFDNHEIVYAEAAPTESLYLGGDQAQLAVGEEAFKELEMIFGEELLDLIHQSPVAYLPNNKEQKELVAQFAACGKAPCDLHVEG